MLAVKNIHFRFGKAEILREISFEASAGKMVGILGSNGAGKSTLLKIISKEYKPTSGEVAWNDRLIDDYKVEEMALERAILTQQIHISQDFPTDEVVLMGRYVHFKSTPNQNDWEAVEHAMYQTHTLKFRDRGYQSLSGGEKQRVQLARALSQLDSPDRENGKLFLLDEPLNNLDIKHQHHCLRLARRFAKMGNTVLIVMHDINLASFYSDEILLLNKGSIQAYGNPKEVLTENNLIQAYDFPVSIQQHPFSNCPVAFFGTTEQKFY